MAGMNPLMDILLGDHGRTRYGGPQTAGPSVTPDTPRYVRKITAEIVSEVSNAPSLAQAEDIVRTAGYGTDVALAQTCMRNVVEACGRAAVDRLHAYVNAAQRFSDRPGDEPQTRDEILQCAKVAAQENVARLWDGEGAAKVSYGMRSKQAVAECYSNGVVDQLVPLLHELERPQSEGKLEILKVMAAESPVLTSYINDASIALAQGRDGIGTNLNGPCV